MISLKDFIATSMGEIVEAVQEFDAAHAESGATLTPHVGAGSETLSAIGLIRETGNTHPVMAVQFDVAVSAEQQSAGQAGASAKIAVLGVGIGANAGGEKTDTHSHVSRIQFTLPLRIRRSN